MSILGISSPSLRRTTIGSTVLAAMVVVTMGLGTSAASADDLSSGHIDFVSVGTSGSSLAMGSNFEDTAFVSSDTYQLKVPLTSGASGTGYILPQTQVEAEARGVPFAGFSGDPALRGAPLSFSAGNTVTVKLESVAFTPASGATGAGTVSISQDGVAWFTGAAKSHVFTVEGSDDEAFHQHAKWQFSEKGTYTMTFSATGKGRVASAQTYVVKAGV